MHHTIFTVLWEKLHRVSRSVIKHANEVSRETKKHFPAETMCLGIGQINQNGCYRDQIKLLPHPKGEFFSLHSVPWRHTYNHLGKLPTPLSGGVRASGRYKFSNFGDLTSDQSTVAGMTKLSLLKEFIKNLRIIHAPGHFTQHQQNQYASNRWLTI